MPKKRSASTSDSDSGPEDRMPEKKSKPEEKPKAKASKSESGDKKFPLDKKKNVTVREFRGTVYVDIREFYEKDGELLPGKKGISLSVANWNKLKDLVSDIDDAVSQF